MHLPVVVPPLLVPPVVLPLVVPLPAAVMFVLKAKPVPALLQDLSLVETIFLLIVVITLA